MGNDANAWRVPLFPAAIGSGTSTGRLPQTRELKIPSKITLWVRVCLTVRGAQRHNIVLRIQNAIDQRRQHFKGSALFVIIGIGRGADSLASTEDPVQMEPFILAPAPHHLLTIM